MAKLSELVNSNNFNLSTLNQVFSEQLNGLPGRTRSIDISFWGTRWVKMNDDPEFVDLDVVADKVLQRVKKLQESHAQSGGAESEAAAGLSCLAEIRELYQKSEGDLLTRTLRAFRRVLDYITDPFGNSTGWRSIEQTYDFSQGNISFDSFTPYNIELVLKTIAPRDHTPQARVMQLKKFQELVRLQETFEAHITDAFSELHPLYQKEIKDRMFLMTGVQSDWTGTHPIRRLDLAEILNLLLSQISSEDNLYYLLADMQASRIPSNDDVIRKAFSKVRYFSQQFIKKRMWEMAGGMNNPQFAAGQHDWAGDQLRANPLTFYQRQLILAAAAETNATINAAIARLPLSIQFYPELIDVEDAISRLG